MQYYFNLYIFKHVVCVVGYEVQRWFGWNLDSFGWSRETLICNICSKCIFSYTNNLASKLPTRFWTVSVYVRNAYTQTSLHARVAQKKQNRDMRHITQAYATAHALAVSACIMQLSHDPVCVGAVFSINRSKVQRRKPTWLENCDRVNVTGWVDV